MYDVLIIGAGVSGCACARELSRYDARVLVIDKEDDVCCGTSKANSAIVHAGYDASPGSLMAKHNVEGNALMGALAEELDIPFRRNGSFVVCFSEEDRPGLVKLLEQGRTNGVPDLRILERHELIAMEPGLSDDIVAALYAPTAGIICPFTLTVALAENAAANGVEFRFNTAATEALWWTRTAVPFRPGRSSTPPGCIPTSFTISLAQKSSTSSPGGEITACWTGRRAGWWTRPSFPCPANSARVFW